MNEKQARKVTRERSGEICERCSTRRADTMHHRKNRSQGGTWDPSNLLHLCGDGTRGCHGVITNTRTQFYDAGWCVHGWDTPAEVAVLYRGGWVLLDDEGGVTGVAEAVAS